MLSHTGTDKKQHFKTNQTEQTQALPLLTQARVSTHTGRLRPALTPPLATQEQSNRHSHIAEGEGQRVYGRVDLSEHLPLVVLIHLLEVHTCPTYTCYNLANKKEEFLRYAKSIFLFTFAQNLPLMQPIINIIYTMTAQINIFFICKCK